MGFEAEVTDEFVEWYQELDADERAAIEVRVDLLAEEGPNLKRPVVGEIVGSKFDPQMKELRASVGQSTLRALFVFDPRAPPSCCSAATRPVSGRAGTAAPSPKPTTYTTST